MPFPSHLPVITLTSDFGLSDHYVGTMKGVILSRCPNATVVDICHQVPPFSILAGAYTISQAAPYFPPGTIHVVIVDPGVGTARKPLFVEACSQRFIAPDNGVLSFLFDRDPKAAARELTNSTLFLENVSATFHGRDIFAAVAGALAANQAKPEDLGPSLHQPQMLPNLKPRFEGGAWHGILLSVDHFGNLISNFQVADAVSLRDRSFELRIRDLTITSWHATFGGGQPGVPFAYFGSSGFVEIGVKQASAAALCQAEPGTPLTLTLGQ